MSSLSVRSLLSPFSLRSKFDRRVRNVAEIGHSHSGKTALVEWMLFDEKVINKRPSAGESFLDSDPVEASRHSSVFSHYARVPHRDHASRLLILLGLTFLLMPWPLWMVLIRPSSWYLPLMESRVAPKAPSSTAKKPESNQ